MGNHLYSSVSVVLVGPFDWRLDFMPIARPWRAELPLEP